MFYILRNQWVDGAHIISAHKDYAEGLVELRKFACYGHFPENDRHADEANRPFAEVIARGNSDDGDYATLTHYGQHVDTDVGEWQVYRPNSGVDIYLGKLTLDQALDKREFWRKTFGDNELRLVPLNLDDWLIEPPDFDGIRERGDIRALEEIEAEMEEDWPFDEHDMFRDDSEADADVLRNAGMGTDEDYGYYGGDDPWE